MVAEWMESALCKSIGMEWFYLSDSNTSIKVANRVCGGCPVRAACRIASTPERYGVWGGRTESAREVDRRRAGIRLALNDADIKRYHDAAERAYKSGKYVEAMAAVAGRESAKKWLARYV